MAPPDASAAEMEAVYQERILEHYRRPRNKGTLPAPDATAARRNPLCGDELELQLAFLGDRVEAARFTARGCSIVQASASMMTEVVQGRTAAEADALMSELEAMLRGTRAGEPPESLGDLRALSPVSRLPARVRCAMLPWEALAEALGTRKGATAERGSE